MILEIAKLTVERHPAGGWTLATPIDPTRTTARIYRGRFNTCRGAKRALIANFSP
jgi:hypothetical protein